MNPVRRIIFGCSQRARSKNLKNWNFWQKIRFYLYKKYEIRSPKRIRHIQERFDPQRSVNYHCINGNQNQFCKSHFFWNCSFLSKMVIFYLKIVNLTWNGQILTENCHFLIWDDHFQLKLYIYELKISIFDYKWSFLNKKWSLFIENGHFWI